MDYGILFWPEGLNLKSLKNYTHAAFHFTRHLFMDRSRVDYLRILTMFLSAV